MIRQYLVLACVLVMIVVAAASWTELLLLVLGDR